MTDRETLRWCGRLGHTYVVITTSKDGARHGTLETCSLESAREYAAGEAEGRSPVIYRQTAPGKWRRIPERKVAHAA